MTLDLREEFRRAVVAPFVRGYARGETPNPCITCNGSFRFAELLAFAERAGAAKLATGHYARIVRHGDRLLLARGADPEKDQSYMLARLDPRFLDRLWFPLGEQTKTETRAEAEAAGLAAAHRAESQEACFLAGDDYRTFLERHGLAAEDGRDRRRGRAELGEHDGFWRFTPGQRRGIGGLSSRSRSTRSARMRRRTRSSSGRGRRSRRPRSRREAACTSTPTASTRSSATALRRYRRVSR